jgi:hypothetical protein
MTCIVGLLALALLLQAMRALSGVRLVIAGVLCLGLLWPLTKLVLKGEATHYAVRTVARQVAAPPDEDHKSDKDIKTAKDALGCRFWNTVDRHKKHGLVRDAIRAACHKEEEQ